MYISQGKPQKSTSTNGQAIKAWLTPPLELDGHRKFFLVLKINGLDINGGFFLRLP